MNAVPSLLAFSGGHARSAGALTAFAMGVALISTPPFARDVTGGVPMNLVLVVVATVVGFLLAPRLRGATGGRVLQTALLMLFLSILLGAVFAGSLMAVTATLQDRAIPDPLGVRPFEPATVLLPFVLALIGLLFVGPPLVLIGMPVAVAWAAVVRWLISQPRTHVTFSDAD